VTAARPGTLRRLSRTLVRQGVTAYAPTIWTSSPERTLAALRAVAAARATSRAAGPSWGRTGRGPTSTRGAAAPQDQGRIRPFDPDELDLLAGTGALARMTVAPEAAGNEGLVAALARRGVRPSVGHSDADTVAGSCLTLDAALRNLAGATGAGRAELWPTVARTPARLGLLTTGTPVVTVALRTPWDLSAYPEAGTHLCTYGLHPPPLRALARTLVTGDAPGRLPVAAGGRSVPG
jgi:N-acetylglucosamine-6-phosphate deacetylase